MANYVKLETHKDIDKTTKIKQVIPISQDSTNPLESQGFREDSSSISSSSNVRSEHITSFINEEGIHLFYNPSDEDVEIAAAFMDDAFRGEVVCSENH